jgi:hypothetical protein
MRDLTELDKYRVKPDAVDPRYEGAFVVPRPMVVTHPMAKQLGGDDFVLTVQLCIIASNDGGWDHVSVSVRDRCPTWDEMEHIAKLFFKENEVAMQLYVPATDHINNMPFCLHWWRPHSKLKPIPLPPKRYV